MPRSARFAGAFLLLAMLWGTGWLSSAPDAAREVLLRDAAIASALGACILLVSTLVFGVPPPALNVLSALARSAFLMIVIPTALVVYAGRTLASAVIAFGLATAPLAVAAFGWVGWDRPVPRRSSLALLVATGILWYLFSAQLLFQASQLAALASLTVALVSIGAATIHARRTFQEAPVLSSVTIVLGVASVGLLLASACFEHPASTKAIHLESMLLGAARFAVGFALYYWLIRYSDALKAASVRFVVPVAAILQASVIGREPVPANVLVACACILACVGAILAADPLADSFVSLTSLADRE